MEGFWKKGRPKKKGIIICKKEINVEMTVDGRRRHNAPTPNNDKL